MEKLHISHTVPIFLKEDQTHVVCAIKLGHCHQFRNNSNRDLEKISDDF